MLPRMPLWKTDLDDHNLYHLDSFYQEWLREKSQKPSLVRSLRPNPSQYFGFCVPIRAADSLTTQSRLVFRLPVNPRMAAEC